MTKTQSFVLSLEPDVKWMSATTTTWTTNADWLCAWRGRCTVYTPHQVLWNCISCKRKSPIWKDLLEKNTVHSMLKIPNSMLPTNCWTVTTKLTKKKNSWSREHNISTLLNQIYSSFFGAFELLVGPLSELLLWKNWRGSASCNCWTLFVQPVANLHCFIAIITLVHWSIWTLCV